MKNLSIRVQLALSVMAFGGLILLAQMALQFYVLRADIVQRIEKHEFRALKDFASYLDEKLQDSMDMLASEAVNVPEVAAHNLPALERHLQREKALFRVYDDLYVFDARGVLLVDWPQKPGRRQLDMSERDYIQGVIQRRQTVISAPILGKATRQPIVVVATPILDAQGALKGIFAGVLNLYKPNLLGSIATRPNGEKGYHYLVSADRVRIAHPDPKLLLQRVPENSQNEPFERAMQGFEGTAEGVNTRGLRGLFTFARLQTTGWVVASVIPTQEAFAPIRQIYEQMLLVTCVLMVAFLPLLWGLSRRVVRSFTRLSAAMEQTAQHMRDGEPVRPIDVGGSAEIKTVTRAFNAFVEARIQAEKELAMARDAAQEANASKSQFLANMSHEIRTPMNGILGMTELCLQTRMTQEQSNYLEMVMSSGRSLLAVINDILDFSKIEARKLVLDPHEFGLRDLVRDCIRTLSLRAAEKGLEMICEIGDDVPDRLVADPSRLHQVLTNLLANAIKFTAQGEIVLSIHRLEARAPDVLLQWSVKDSGIGIPLDKQAMIFDTFTQADSGTARRYGGSGLGLAISRNLVQMMGGSIHVDSQPGQGSTFRYTTRLQRAPEHATRQPQWHEPLAGLHILVVDDNASARRWLAGELERMGAHALACDGASQAMQAVQSLPIRHALIDVNMPEIDGYALTRELRKLKTPEAMGIVLMGHLGEQICEEQMREHQVQGYLVKPVDPQELVTVLLSGAAVPPDVPATLAQVCTRVATLADACWRVLLVEDTPVNQTLATLLLTRMGHEVTVASNGREAVEAYASGQFDVVLMDIQMPEMSGTEATVAIRSMQREQGRRHTPIIAVTAHALKGDRERYLGSGMDGYVTKPLSVEALKSEMRHCIAAAQGSALASA